MKQFIAILAVVSLAMCEPPSQYGAPQGGGGGGYQQQQQQYNANNNVPILRYDSNNDGVDGSYNYAYETGDGTSAQEQGYQKGEEAPAAQGSFAFTAPDGAQYSISYTADENGFLPQGAHIPTPPPIPEEILKGLEQNRADEARGIVDDGQYRPDPSEGYSGHQQKQGGY